MTGGCAAAAAAGVVGSSLGPGAGVAGGCAAAAGVVGSSLGPGAGAGVAGGCAAAGVVAVETSLGPASVTEIHKNVANYV